MIITAKYGLDGIRWYCSNCDTKGTAYGSSVSSTNWTNGQPPKVCDRCDPHREYHVKLDLNILLPETTSSEVRELIAANKEQLALSIRRVLSGRDAQLHPLACTARPHGKSSVRLSK